MPLEPKELCCHVSTTKESVVINKSNSLWDGFEPDGRFICKLADMQSKQDYSGCMYGICLCGCIYVTITFSLDSFYYITY